MSTIHWISIGSKKKLKEIGSEKLSLGLGENV